MYQALFSLQQWMNRHAVQELRLFLSTSSQSRIDNLHVDSPRCLYFPLTRFFLKPADQCQVFLKKGGAFQSWRLGLDGPQENQRHLVVNSAMEKEGCNNVVWQVPISTAGGHSAEGHTHNRAWVVGLHVHTCRLPCSNVATTRVICPHNCKH